MIVQCFYNYSSLHCTALHSSSFTQNWHWQCTLHLVPVLAFAVHSLSCPSTGTGRELFILSQHWHWHLAPVLALAVHSSSCLSTGIGSALFILSQTLGCQPSCLSTGTGSALFILSQHWHWQCTLNINLVPALALALCSSSCPSTGTGTLHLVPTLAVWNLYAGMWFMAGGFLHAVNTRSSWPRHFAPASHTHTLYSTHTTYLHFAHALKDVDIIIGCTNIGTILTHVRYDKSSDADDLINFCTYTEEKCRNYF